MELIFLGIGLVYFFLFRGVSCVIFKMGMLCVFLNNILNIKRVEINRVLLVNYGLC